MKNKFTFLEYLNILETITHHGYKSVSFNEFNPNKKYQMLLRHDIDYNYFSALDFAIIEYNLNIKATYFFLLTENYNIISNQIQEILKDLKELNHTIGLHYDYQSQILENLSEISIKEMLTEFSIISDHRPAKNITRIHHNKIINVYDKKYAWDIKYYSDSNKKWKFGYPLDNLKGNNFQLLTHPVWWTVEPKKTKEDSYSVFLKQLVNNLKEKFKNRSNVL